MKKIIALCFLALSTQAFADDTPITIEKYKQQYDKIVNEIAPELKTTTCHKGNSDAIKGKSMLTCYLVIKNGMLMLDAYSNNVLHGNIIFNKESIKNQDVIDIPPAIFARIARGEKKSGNYLDFGKSVLDQLFKKHPNNPIKDHECLKDWDSNSIYCAMANTGQYAFHFYRYQMMP